MSTYKCVTRTNYFRVKNTRAFERLVRSLKTDGEDVLFWKQTRSDGTQICAFGCESQILGLEGVYGEDPSFDAFTDEMKQYLYEGEPVIIFEAGHEKLRYITAGAYIVTCNDTAYVDLEEAAKMKAEEMIGTRFDTVCCY